MRRIGNDISLEVCRNEGYLIIEFDARKKFSPDMGIRIIQYEPDYLVEELNKTYGFKNKPGLMVDTTFTFNELVEMYEPIKTMVNSFAETQNSVDFVNPGYYDFFKPC